MFPPKFIGYLVLSALVAQAAPVVRNDLQSRATCDPNVKWPSQTQDLVMDIVRSNLYYGLSRPVSATLLMVAHLNELYLSGEANTILRDGCSLEDTDRHGLELALFNDPDYCAIQIPFTSRDLVPKKADLYNDGQTFGILPLILKKVYQRIITGDYQVGSWAQGDTWEAHAANTRHFFSVVTVLPLEMQKVSTLDDGSVHASLNACKTSPVFLVTSEGLSMVTSYDSTAHEWHGYDIRYIATPKRWTMETIKARAFETHLIYNKDHGSLPTTNIAEGSGAQCSGKKLIIVQETFGQGSS